MSAEDIFQVGGEGYFRRLCEQMGIALIATDQDLSIQAWNAAAARMFGAGVERMIGAPVTSIVPQERRAVAERMVRRSIETGQTLQLEFQHRDPEGKHRELTATIAPIVSESSVCIGASVCIRDITRRIMLQDELSESRKMASLGALAGAIAHHFNNILGGVITSVDYAQASGDQAITGRVLRQISRALQRAATLVNGLLAFAEGDRSAEDLADFTEVVYELADELDQTIEGRGIEFTLDVPNLPVLPVARVQVYTAMRNIARNAIEAMPHGGKLTIDVSLEEAWIVTRITDTGVGLDQSAISHVFEPFWSTKADLASSSIAASGGIGLGLAIVHGLVQTIGGTISVSSEPNKGACFTVSLPRPDVEQD